MKISRPLIAIAAAATITMGSMSAASAQTVRHTDSGNDVYGETNGADVRQPGRSEDDIMNTVVTYSGNNLKMTMSFHGLSQSGQGALFVFDVRTNNGVRRDVQLATGRNRWNGVPTVAQTTGNQNIITCVVPHTISYTLYRVSVTVPRACLGNPTWVQVGMGVKGTANDGTGYVDDANTSGDPASTLMNYGSGANLVLGARVYRN